MYAAQQYLHGEAAQNMYPWLRYGTQQYPDLYSAAAAQYAASQQYKPPATEFSKQTSSCTPPVDQNIYSRQYGYPPWRSESAAVTDQAYSQQYGTSYPTSWYKTGFENQNVPQDYAYGQYGTQFGQSREYPTGGGSSVSMNSNYYWTGSDPMSQTHGHGTSNPNYTSPPGDASQDLQSNVSMAQDYWQPQPPQPYTPQQDNIESNQASASLDASLPQVQSMLAYHSPAEDSQKRGGKSKTTKMKKKGVCAWC